MTLSKLRTRFWLNCVLISTNMSSNSELVSIEVEGMVELSWVGYNCEVHLYLIEMVLEIG